MMSSYHLVAAVVLLAMAIRESAGSTSGSEPIRCIECNSYSEPECDANPMAFKTDCPANATSCRKMEQEIYYEDDYHVRTIRQCAFESGPMKCNERTGTYRFKVFYCHCTGEYCNSSGFMSVSLILVSLCGALAYLFKL